VIDCKSTESFVPKLMLELKYRGYEGKVQYDSNCGLYCGRVIMTDSSDVVTFKGVNVIEVNDAFRDSVDDYLEFCKEF